ncbi:hypothetical protein D3C81_1791610 [compost metagenome]
MLPLCGLPEIVELAEHPSRFMPVLNKLHCILLLRGLFIKIGLISVHIFPVSCRYTGGAGAAICTIN